jgi:hypothetical protein
MKLEDTKKEDIKKFHIYCTNMVLISSSNGDYYKCTDCGNIKMVFKKISY